MRCITDNLATLYKQRMEALVS